MRQRYLQFAVMMTMVLSLPVSAADPRLDEAARQAAQANDAKVLSARTIKRPGGQTDQIKMLTRKGVVRTIQVPRNNQVPGSNPASRPNLPPRTNQAPNQGKKKDR